VCSQNEEGSFAMGWIGKLPTWIWIAAAAFTVGALIALS
jgi:hypothetical protein